MWEQRVGFSFWILKERISDIYIYIYIISWGLSAIVSAAVAYNTTVVISMPFVGTEKRDSGHAFCMSGDFKDFLCYWLIITRTHS